MPASAKVGISDGGSNIVPPSSRLGRVPGFNPTLSFYRLISSPRRAKAEDLEQGDLVPNYDFRGAYTSIVEDWLGLDAKPIVNGTFEKLGFL